MGLNITKLATDKEKIEKGTWIDIADGARVKIARMNNESYNAYCRKHGKHIAMQARVGAVDQNDSMKVFRAATANHILLDWSGIQDENAQEIPYGVDKAIELFTQYEDFFTMIVDLANDRENFRADVKEMNLGN